MSIEFFKWLFFAVILMCVGLVFYFKSKKKVEADQIETPVVEDKRSKMLTKTDLD